MMGITKDIEKGKVGEKVLKVLQALASHNISIVQAWVQINDLFTQARTKK